MNLKKLSDEEVTVLARHGSSPLAARIDQYAPELRLSVFSHYEK